MKTKLLTMTAAITAAFTLSNCGPTGMRPAHQDAATGAAIGAIGGAIIGHQSDNAAAGAALGGIIGGATGYAVGRNKENQSGRGY